jgi:cobalt/nickel transport system ATP-binding protein
MSTLAFDLRNASYSYERVSALEDISLQIRQGERIALLGANGSGKSTLLRLLAALSFCKQGQILFFGQELSAKAMEQAEFFYTFRRRAGIVFQNPDVQLFMASVFDEVAFGPLQLGWPKEKVRSQVAETLAAMGIESLAERPPYRLSSGEKKRVALASVLVTEPEVVLLDEPAATLDPASQNTIVDLLRSWAGTSRTVVTATHDLDLIESIADRCVVLHRGSVAAEGEPYAVLHDLPLLEHTGLLRPQHHHHAAASTKPHGHLHVDDLA